MFFLRKIPILLPVLFSLLLTLSCYGQDKKLKKPAKSSFRSESYLEKAELEHEKNPKEALKYIEHGLSSAISNKDSNKEAKAYQLLGKINFNQGFYEQAISNFIKSERLFRAVKNEPEIWESGKMLALSYEKAGKVKEAETVYQKLLALAESNKNTDQIVFARNGLGRVSGQKGEYNQAIAEYEKVLDLEQSRKNTSGIIITNNAIGEVLEKQNKNQEALEVYSKAEELAFRTKDSEGFVSTSKNIKEIYRKEGRVQDELSLRIQSLKSFEVSNNLPSISEECNQIAGLYLKQNKPDQALSYLKKGLEVSQQIQDLEKMKQAYRSLSDAYRQKNDYLNALKSYESFVKLSDTLWKASELKFNNQISLNQELSSRQKKIEFLEKDLEINSKALSLLQSERKLQQLVIYSLGAVLLVFGIASVAIFRISRKRRRANLLLALKSLRTQMNPHFIFNALNSVNSFIAQRNERAANKYLSDFSRLMREVMENSQHDFIPLSTEIRILQLYMTLEHARFDDKFDYSLTVAPEIDTDSAFIPPMLVQPYVENAVWHGLRYKAEKGFLQVSFSIEKKSLVIRVMDNGIGRKKSQELKTANQKARISTGLKNTANRIKLINEIHHTGLKVTVKDPEAQSGTIVIIEIPLKQEEV